MRYYQEKIEYLKRKIKRTYKWYTGERVDGQSTIEDIAKLFSIELDNTRLNDYTISSIDFNIPSIEIYDKKRNTTYKSEFTSDAKLLNYSGGDVCFVNVKSFNPICETESIGYIGADNYKKKVIRFIKDNYELSIEREFGSVDTSKIESTVRYIERHFEGIRENKEYLLNKVYSKEKDNNIFGQTFTYGFPLFYGPNDNQDKYYYHKKDNIIYGVNELEINIHNKKIGLNGAICFERTQNLNLEKYRPLGMHLDNYPKLYDKENISAMIFSGYDKEPNRYRIEIYKTNEGINVIYTVTDYEGKVNTDSFDIKVSGTKTSEPISTIDIQNIIECLNLKYPNEFTTMVSSQLIEFDKKIKIRKGLIEEEQDLLSPKLLMNKTFEEIENQIGTDIEGYFELIEKQFYDATHINEARKNKQKVK